MKIDHTNIPNLSIADAEIEIFEGSKDQKSLKIRADKAILMVSGLKNYGKVNLEFGNWKSITIRANLEKGKNWEDRDFNEPMQTVSEEDFTSENYRIAGFGKKTKEWLEYLIAEPQISGSFEIVTES